MMRKNCSHSKTLPKLIGDSNRDSHGLHVEESKTSPNIIVEVICKVNESLGISHREILVVL
jgi:hypothetical protein